MTELFHKLQSLIIHQISANQFLSGGLVLGAITSILVTLRNVPTNLWHKIRRRIVFEVTIDQNDDLYPWVQNWMNANYTDQLRSVRASYSKSNQGAEPATIRIGDEITKVDTDKVEYNHYGDTFKIWRHNRIITISSQKEKLEQAQSFSNLFFQKYYITGLAAKKAIKLLISEVIDYNKKLERDKVIPKIKTHSYQQWHTDRCGKLRNIDNIFIPQNQKNEIVNSIQEFLNKKEFYIQRDIPYRLGIILDGPPGTGKSSLVSALAKYFKRDLYVIDLKGASDENTFLSLMREVDPGSILLIEDIDRYYNGDKAETKINYSSFINAISGVKAREDVILIITTNHKDKLDQALLRSGRMDRHFTIGLPGSAEVNAYLSWFYGKPIQVGCDVNFTMADLENICVQNKNDYARAIETIYRFAPKPKPVPKLNTAPQTDPNPEAP